MHRLLSLVLLVSGIVLIIYGLNALDSIGSAFSRLFTGAPTDKTLWLLLVGFIAAALGSGGLVNSSKSP